MLQMTEFIFSQITEKIDPSSSKQVIRVDGLDDLRIYQHLCEKLDVYCHHHDMDLIAKLSRRKFEQFKGRYAYEAEQLTLKHWVDFDDHMTSYRNLVPQPGRKLLIVLMGTDMVTDKGGLSDFYAITPHTIDQKVGKNYASLMGSELRTQLDMDKIAPIVNTFFDSLFSCVPQDLSRVSEIMDGWRTSLPSPDEVTENLYAGLPQWQIPMIRDAVPSSIGKKTDKANGILASGYKFISGKTYSKITKATITSVEKKFDSYQEKEKRYAAFYPEGQALSSLGDLRDAVLSFLSGNRTDELRRKLLYTDYSIIEDVLKTKLPSPRHEKQKTVVGSPLQALSQALLSMAGKATFPVDTFHLSFETASMAGVSSKQDKDMKDDENDEHVHSLLEAWSRITCFAGGIIDFLTEDGHLFGCDEFQLVFEPVDFFAPSKAYDLYESGILKPCTGVNHKIEFHIDALLEGDVIETQSFIWQIRPSDDWLNAFGELFDFPKDCKAYLPFPKVDEINTAFTLKDEESFTYWFDHTKKSYADILSSRLHEGSLEKQEEANQFALLGKSFMIWRDAVVNKGFFSTLSAETRDLVSAYTKLAEHIAHTPIYTGNAYDLCRLFMNAFTIRACGPDTIGTDEGDQYIVPPYHPAALEKIAERMRFIRQGLSEWLASALTPDEKCEPLQDRMDQLLSLSTLHNATDAFFLDAAHLQPCTSSYGYYTLYGFPKQQQEFVSAIDIQRAESVFEDDFEDAEMKRLTQEARFLLSVLKRYTATYPQAREALSVTFINPDNLQTVVSSLYQYFVDLRKELSQDTPILMRLHVIMRNEIHGARAYLSYWINHVFTSDDNLDMKVYLNVYEKDQDIPALVPDVTDLVFFFDALNTERCATYNFNVMQETPVVTNHHCRYPLVFRPMFTGSHEFDHTIAITQPQFSAATAHTQVLRLYRDKHVYDERYGLIQVSALDRHLDSVIMNIQEKTTWLTCIDPAIDKHSVLNMYARDTGIIGFTTGEGSFGQMNAVMTCKRSIAEDIHQRFALRLHYMFPKWTDEQIKNASSFCMEKAKQMNGVSVLRAMNPSDYEMNNFMAYLIADELTRHTDATLNVLIHMDSYRHWLQGRTYDEGAHVPDFLHIQASLEPGRPLHLVATVIESKIAKNDDLLSTHLDKAREQVLDGLSVLRRHFDPNDTSVEHRYWLSQLYRAILFLLGDLNLDDQQACDLSAKLSEMLQGHFEIEWHGRILGCAIDSRSDMHTTYLEGDDIPIELMELGQQAIQNILLHQNLDVPVIYDDTARIDETVDPAQTDEAPHDTLPSDPHEETGSEEMPSEKSSSADHHETEPVALEKVRILIGRDHADRDVYWEFGHMGLSNRHLMITGSSGQGKTYAIQTFLFELARQNISSVIFDYTDGFLPGKLEKPFEDALAGKITQYIAIQNRIPINPFKLQSTNLSGILVEDKPPLVAGRFASILKHVYKFGDQQFSAIYCACRDGIEQYGDQMNFDHLHDLLKDSSFSAAKSVLSKMQQFFDMDLFDTEHAMDWSSITERDGKITVIQLTTLDKQIQTIITEMLMWDAWYSLVKTGQASRPFVVVLDEAQNLSFEDGSPAQKILQEGRKYGWSAWFATQFLKGALTSDEISRLQQAEEKLYFKPADAESLWVAQSLADDRLSAQDWHQTIKKMQKGSCIVSGSRVLSNGSFSSAAPVKVQVCSFEDRTETDH